VIRYYVATALWIAGWSISGAVNIKLAILAYGDLRAASTLGAGSMPAVLAQTQLRAAAMQAALCIPFVTAGVAALFLPVPEGAWELVLEAAVDAGAAGMALVSGLDLRDRLRARRESLRTARLGPG
jgi:hypothetical protein